MGIRESLLNTITSVGNSDFVRIVTSAGASSKATVANLFKSFESNLSAKSSLTTSDYIRVVGSDNESYKQSMSSVKSTLGVTELESGALLAKRNGTLLSDGTDLDTLDRGVYYSSGASLTNTLVNCPITGAAFRLIVLDSGYGSTAFAQQILISGVTDANAGLWYRKKNLSSGQSWSEWRRTASGAEVDALNSKTYASYTPTITGGTDFAVNNVVFTYQEAKDFLWIAGRFEITNAGSTNAVIRIPYPSGVTAKATGVVPIGSVLLNKNYSGAGPSLRTDSTNGMFIQVGAGGYSAPALGTGYILLYALIPR